MRTVSMKQMLLQAQAGGYAVGQYNINGVQWVQAILRAAQAEQAPVILAASDRLVSFLGGYALIAAIVDKSIQELSITVPVALHLDHGMSVEHCKQAIDNGFSSVMIDGSHYPIEQNIAMTLEVVKYASSFGVSVEAEVGTVGGMEDGLIGGIQYADPLECDRLVKETGVDALAAALGSVHGPYQGEPVLGFAEMKHIADLTGVPLVLHGGSGIPAHQIRQAIELGHAKINVNTECIQAWASAVRTVLNQNPQLYDPSHILTPGTEAVQQVVQNKMQEFGTSGQAMHMV
ncbi:class II fructose-1,6-bisphosphate aldolase [Paenibacillus sp. KACC 21273]|uniref:class II fructose-1,6-bisphosphate aldolase n=1 Tax=Paenibacillus sp. KACC 21273 TaxID=3025665 RepID=UPI002366205E|nr:class II fructose-1,6-bisphosphate aldolase [Paenibacillus sp. KACC 21273]WDF51889.1 class II fructose-1,6-bisphosphate aldolase [Paenibacillus sp. KACC 21273]